MSATSASRELPPEPTTLLAELIGLARRFGADAEFSRGGGGNASIKDDGVLYIKASGVPLAEMAIEALVPLDMAPLLKLLEGDASGEAGTDHVMRAATVARLAEAGGRRPSVELLFHALMPERFVLHTHPIVLNAVVCNRDGAALAARLFGDRALWIPYADPGLPLARAIAAARMAFEERTAGPAPRVTLMQNHGIVIAGESATVIEELSRWLTATVRAELERHPGLRAEAAGPATEAGGAVAGPATGAGGDVADPAGGDGAGPDAGPATGAGGDGGDGGDGAPVSRERARMLVDAIGPALRGLLATGAALKVVAFDDTPPAVTFTATPAGRAFVLGGPLTPDQIVYAGSWPLLLDLPADLAAGDVLPLLRARLDEHAATKGGPPIVLVVPGLGLFAAADSWAQADTARHIYLDALRVAEGALRLGGVRALGDAERTFIEEWEAEAYRRGVAAGVSAPGRAAGKVALVTGAAQGFGLAIATDLVSQGAHVVLADLNVTLAAANAADLEARFGPGRATPLGLDVMDEGSVADGIHATVSRYGGIDLLVSNAGVLRAGGVTTQPLAEFDLVTRVNYRGYFLCVRFAAPVMARQHAARPAWLGDIIEVNSKSGLGGSSRNSAYAGSKFGGIGLTQSFALELVGDGIKVNAICPGNFLDGPLWSDPQNGLFVQYLREGKVPGAVTIDDVRHAYEAKVPMGRGCSPADVLEALYYLVAQQYETGQALPVTGGQVMLS